MKLKKFQVDETGFMLLENMVTLSIIAILLILIYPLMTDWLLLREAAKNEVEQARVLYETSMTWPAESSQHANFNVLSTDATITVQYNNTTIGVEIYASQIE